MKPLLNLLPKEYVTAQTRAYYMRLSVVGLAAGIILIIIAAVLLVPAYRFVTTSLEAQQMLLATQEQEALEQQPDLGARLSTLEHNENRLLALRTVPSTSEVIRRMLNVSRTGVRLVSIAYTSPTPEQPTGALVISGIASDRDALQTYKRVLESTPGVTSTELPLSAYAKDTNIPFAITVRLAP